MKERELSSITPWLMKKTDLAHTECHSNDVIKSSVNFVLKLIILICTL